MSQSEALWLQSCRQLEKDLEDEQHNLLGHIDVKDLEAFQAAIGNLCIRYTRLNVSALVRNRLTPHFEHLMSFDKAITLSAQMQMPSALIWSGTLAVIECGCRFTTHLNQILDVLEDFYKALPRLEDYMALFPGNKRLEYPLRDLFADYGSFCVQIIKWVCRKPLVNILKHMVSSGPQQRLRSIMASMEVHKRDFEKEVELAFRQNQMKLKVIENSSTGQPSDAYTLSTSHYMVVERKDPNFLGRDSVLKDIHSRFNSSKFSPMAEARSYLIYGLSGIGKTSTALEYTYRYRGSYDFVFWMAAETTSDLVRSYAQVVFKLRSLDLIPRPAPQDAENTGIDDARDWFETTDRKWLLVLDNVEDWQSILRYWPTTATAESAILVTAQKQEFRRQTTYNVLLQDLSIEDGSQLLLSYIDRESTSSEREVRASREIVKMFGGLPLAIAHIGGYVSDAPCSLSEFLELAEQRYRSLWECELTVSKAHSVKRLELVWDFALEELPSNAKSVVYTMAFMNPDSMPTAMFLDEHNQHVEDKSEYIIRKAEFIEMIRCLVRRSLVRPASENQEAVLMHRALQRAILFKLDKDPALRYEVFDRAVSAIRKITPSASPIQMPMPKLWPEFEKAVPQILALETAFANSQPSIKGSVKFAQLLYDAAFNTWERESSQDGLRLLATALRVLDDLGYDHDGKLRADIHVMCGEFCDTIGISKRTEALYHRKIALQVRQAVVDRNPGVVDEVDDILLYNAINDTSDARLQYYDYPEAEKLIELCLKRYKTWGTEEEYPFDYAKYYSSKATVLILQRRFEEAIISARKSVALAKLDSGIGPRYLMSLQDLASSMVQSGDITGALAQHHEVFKLREELCGKYHDATLQGAYAIGAMHYHLEDMSEAEVWFRRALDRSERTRWPDEPLCRAQFHLARVIHLQSPGSKRLEEAVALETKAREALARLLQHDLPKYLIGVEDELVLFDHLQPIFRGKWTGTKLLACIPVR